MGKKRIHLYRIRKDLSTVIGETDVTVEDYQDPDNGTRVQQQVDYWLIQEWQER